ncbi:MAG: MaoC/PaaZ C-terminal domain-containing protein [bacterium]
MSLSNRRVGQGLWFEEFEVDGVMESAGRTITEGDIMNFAGLTGDYSQVHTDEEFCSKTKFGTRIAHGLFGLAIAQGLMWRTNYTQGTGIASLGWDKWSFRKPIVIGDTVHARWTIKDKRESKSQENTGIVTEFVELINQRGEVVQQGEHITMVRLRPASA